MRNIPCFLQRILQQGSFGVVVCKKLLEFLLETQENMYVLPVGHTLQQIALDNFGFAENISGLPSDAGNQLFLGGELRLQLVVLFLKALVIMLEVEILLLNPVALVLQVVVLDFQIAVRRLKVVVFIPEVGALVLDVAVLLLKVVLLILEVVALTLKVVILYLEGFDLTGEVLDDLVVAYVGSFYGSALHNLKHGHEFDGVVLTLFTLGHK